MHLSNISWAKERSPFYFSSIISVFILFYFILLFLLSGFAPWDGDIISANLLTGNTTLNSIPGFLGFFLQCKIQSSWREKKNAFLLHAKSKLIKLI
jgi:amino acid permease